MGAEAQKTDSATWLALEIPGAALSSYGRALGLTRRSCAAHHLARGIASSPCWRDLPSCKLVLRSQPAPELALVGTFAPGHEEFLRRLRGELISSLYDLRFVRWEEAVSLTRVLAERLEGTVGEDRLRQCRFLAIPRGGFVVLGLLAQALDLPRESLQPDTPAPATVVIVDDCVLSGARFGDFLASTSAPGVVFAHLVSHPELRAAIQRRESRVEACIAAQDLAERNTGSAEERSAWARRWRERLEGEDRYWLGQLQHLSFPWNEPDRTVWDSSRQRVSSSWRLLSRDYCLKNRPDGSWAPRIEVIGESEGSFELSEGTFFTRLRESLAVVNFETGQSLSLEGSAAFFFETLLAAADIPTAVRRSAGRYRADPTRLSRDLQGFAEEMARRGFLCLRS